MHELHIWQLVDGLIIASVHVVVSASANWSQVMKRIKTVLHAHGVHSATIQPEFDDAVRPAPRHPSFTPRRSCRLTARVSHPAARASTTARMRLRNVPQR